jgi:histone H2A
MQEKCGVLFPVTRLNNMLKRKFQGRGRVRVGAGIYMAAVLEYLTAEMLELAGNKAIHVKKKRIQPRHILLTIRNDEEFDKLLQNVTIPGGGVSSEIHPFLLPKAKKSTKSALDTKKTTSPPQLSTPAQNPN